MVLRGISSMATRTLLIELAEMYLKSSGVELAIESVGGVDAARRVQGGEDFDFVVLAADAIDRLGNAGVIELQGKSDVVRSSVAIAVRAGGHRPDVSSESALREALLSARSIGYSTGPSGVALLALFERWGLSDELRPRCVEARPGVPVGALLVQGAVALAFQQHSELMHLGGIEILGLMPPGAEIVTTFSAAQCKCSRQAEAVQALLTFLRSGVISDVKRRHGMSPA